MISRPELARAALFVKLTDVPLSWGMPVIVGDGDSAIFLGGGAVAGVLGAGDHRIDPAAFPFFLGMMSDVSPQADVIFLRTVEHGWWPMSAEPYVLIDGRTGAKTSVRFSGSFSVQVVDPRAFATTMVMQDEGWLWAYIESVADRACRDVASTMMHEGYGVGDITTESGARLLAERTIADVAGDLAGRPVRVVRFGSLLVELLPS